MTEITAQSIDEALRKQLDAINTSGQTILMVTHSTAAASRAKRVLFIKDGILYNQIFKGDKSEHQMFQEISDYTNCNGK